MNKNSLLAFVLIAFTVIFFSSSLWNNFWYGTILKRPVPTRTAQNQTAQNQSAADTAANAAVVNGQSSANVPQELCDDDDEECATSAQQAAALASASSNNNNDRNDNNDGNDGNDNRRAVLSDANIEELVARYRASLPDVLSESEKDVLVVTYRERLINEQIAEEVAQISEDTIVVETNRLIATFSTRGARIISLQMKDYTYVAGPRKDELIDVLPLGSEGGAQLTINNESFDEVMFAIVSDTAGANPYQIIFETTMSPIGSPVRKIFTFEDDTYIFDYAVSGDQLAGRNITLGWLGGVDDTEAHGASQPFGAGMDRRRAHYSDGRSVDHFEMKNRGREEPSGMFRWVGMSSKYFFIAIANGEVVPADIKVEGRDVTVRRADGRRPSGEADINYAIAFAFESESNEIAAQIYAGPSRIEELARHGMKFENSLFPVLSWARHIFWADAWFPPLAKFILRVLNFFYGLVKDYGIAIFLLTLLSKVVTFPMTQSSAKTMLRMKNVQPKIVAIRAKHKSNPQKANEEMMALYKAEGINPFNPGCLPMFLQMPIFIALFVVLRKAIELRGATSFVLPWVKDLSLPEALFHLPFALPLYGSNVALMPIIMAALTYFQQKQTITDPNQKMLIYMMPILMLVMFNGFPAGVVFYWTVSSGLGLIQQLWLKPKLPDSKAATATVTVGGVTQSVPVKKYGGTRKRK